MKRATTLTTSTVVMVLVVAGVAPWVASGQRRRASSALGREIAVPVHLQDGQEFSMAIEALLARCKLKRNTRRCATLASSATT
jgi:hypothetical protein